MTRSLLSVLLCVFMLHRIPLPIRVSPETRQRFRRLRTERHLNLALTAALMDKVLNRKFGPAPTDSNELAALVKSALHPEPISG